MWKDFSKVEAASVCTAACGLVGKQAGERAGSVHSSSPKPPGETGRSKIQAFAQGSCGWMDECALRYVGVTFTVNMELSPINS